MHAQFLAISLPKETWNLPTSVSAALLPHLCSQHQWDLRSRLLRGWNLEKPPGLSPRDIKENQIMARPCFSSGPRLPAASRVNPVLLTFQPHRVWPQIPLQPVLYPPHTHRVRHAALICPRAWVQALPRRLSLDLPTTWVSPKPPPMKEDSQWIHIPISLQQGTLSASFLRSQHFTFFLTFGPPAQPMRS